MFVDSFYKRAGNEEMNTKDDMDDLRNFKSFEKRNNLREGFWEIIGLVKNWIEGGKKFDNRFVLCCLEDYKWLKEGSQRIEEDLWDEKLDKTYSEIK